MWLMTADGGFVSIVRHNKIEDCLLVRARVKADLEATFPGYDIDTVPGADYTYRMIIDEQDAAAVIAQAVLDIDYSSHFKDESIKRSPKPEHGSRSQALYAVWNAMANLQGYRPYSKLRRNQEVRITGQKGKAKGKGYDWKADRDAYYNGQEPLWGNYGVPRAAIKPAAESAAVFSGDLADMDDAEIGALVAQFEAEQTAREAVESEPVVVDDVVADDADWDGEDYYADTHQKLAARRRNRRKRRKH